MFVICLYMYNNTLTLCKQVIYSIHYVIFPLFIDTKHFYNF
ncbi:hypothetical protein FM106_02925 [Brachybacterium faecium]|nr:hypothetical protein FM106_02925 [Brachybacterium faecium]